MTTTTEAPAAMDAQEPTSRKSLRVVKTKAPVMKTSKVEAAVPKALKQMVPKLTKAQQATAAPRAMGGVPRADLLPPEVKAAYRGRAVVRTLIIIVAAVAVIVAGGIGFATVHAIASQDALQLERNRSLDLVASQLDFADARQTANKVDAAKAARTLATATEIDWRSYLDEITATLPAGIGLTHLVIEPIVGAEGGAAVENPLQQAAVSTVTITATSTTVPDVEAWFDDLAHTTGFAGIAPPATVTGSPNDGYVVSLQVLVNDKAYLLRFPNDQEK